MPQLNIVLVEPEIPQNTGNISRTCAATGARLHLVEPMGFTIDDKKLKRAGLDYWPLLEMCIRERGNGQANPSAQIVFIMGIIPPACVKQLFHQPGGNKLHSGRQPRPGNEHDRQRNGQIGQTVPHLSLIHI